MKNFNNSLQSDGILLKLDANGQTKWKVSIGGSGREAFQSIVSNGSGDYILAGYSSSNEAFDMNFWLMKFSENASGTDTHSNSEPDNTRIWPNPASDAIYVSTEVLEPGFVHFYVTDLTGRIVRDYRFKNVQPGRFRKEIDLSGLQSGIYFSTLNCNGNSRTIKTLIK